MPHAEYRPFGLAKGRVCTIDEEIATIEALVEQNKIVHLPTIAVECYGEVHKIHVLSMGTPIETLVNILEVALAMTKEAMQTGKAP